MSEPRLILLEEAESTPALAKARGAFYTDVRVADFLVGWAVRRPQDRVLDPSFGGGVFLRSACRRILSLGGRPQDQVFGVEVDAGVRERVAQDVAHEFSVRARNLVCSDFFDIRAGVLPGFEAVVGNPPFIRYQRFAGPFREKAMLRAREGGIELSSLSSSWAPFLVHSAAMLKEGGRLAMVLPVEIGHASYALPLLGHLLRSFAKVTFITFRKRLFPELSEDTLLALAEGKGLGPAVFRWRDMAHAGCLEDLIGRNDFAISGTRPINGIALAQGSERLIEYFIPRNAIGLYRELQSHPSVRRLGDLADVGIGYVTGSNEFFHLGPQDVRRYGIPIAYLRPAVRKARAFAGLRFSVADWRDALASGDAGYLLSIDTQNGLPECVLAYLKEGENQGVPSAFKCRSRSPWYRVPHVYIPDAFLTYMSGVLPRLVANDAKAVAPNSLHVVRLHPEAGLTGDGLAVLWQTSLTLLSAEIQGHAMGGGMLKLEPTEAQSIVLAAKSHNGTLPALAEEIDALLRNGREMAARERVDGVILRQGLGLSLKECRVLRTAADKLRTRRYSRSAPL